MKNVRAIIYGVGRIGQLAARLMLEKGVHIVGAVNRSGPKVHVDLGEVIGLTRPMHVRVTDNPDALLTTISADIAFVAVYDDMERMFPIYEQCLENRMNVITVGAQASYPWRVAPELTARLDRVAKFHNVTMVGTGNQDFFMVNLGTLASGVCHRIDRITHRSLTDADGFGPQVARIACVGLTVGEFESRQLADTARRPSIYTTFWENLAADLGIVIRTIAQQSAPVITDCRMFCKSLGYTIDSGKVVGMTEHLMINTTKGIEFRGDYTLKLCHPSEPEFKAWEIEGEPNFKLTASDMSPILTTASQAVNRIPDVVNALPGYITLEQLPKLRWRPYPFASYVAAAGYSSRC